MDKQFFTLLNDLGIAHKTLEHPAAFSAKDGENSWRDGQDWAFPVKNLFLRDKARQNYLVTIHLDTPAVDLKVLEKAIGASGRLSFGKPEDMQRLLGVQPGSVTPFGLMCDTQNELRFWLDARAQNVPTLSAHPLRNDRTTTIAKADFETFVTHTGHGLNYIEIPLKD